jgi:hypothetical protein
MKIYILISFILYIFKFKMNQIDLIFICGCIYKFELKNMKIYILSLLYYIYLSLK